ncbi:MAG TPA: FAD-dependent oxidoreductase [Gemmatimonadales bacterium]|nr:FAD-dependent oxidoreductase [Gemmatimonadales bacterium]
MQKGQQPHIVVVGAGAFGGWTALYLRRQGARVTLVDAWGPGNSRASSGGETRVIRATYGDRQVYTRMAARALALWKENEKRWQRQLYHGIGVLWLVESDEKYEKAALPILRSENVRVEELSGPEVVRRYPQINCDRVRWAIFEPDGGYLTARRACAAVLEGFLAEGGEYQQLAVQQPIPRGGQLSSVTLSDGKQLTADGFVFACGPWLGSLFPDVIGERIRATRQEVFFFGTPPGDQRFTEGAMPVWADHGTTFMYGIPGNEWRGFKVADDTRGPVINPTTESRVPSPEAIKAARDYMGYRFPDLKGAPLLEARVCQYEESPDEHFIIDRHPAAENAWIVGGGSGHGFKHGPAVGELVARLVLSGGGSAADAQFRLSRFAR